MAKITKLTPDQTAQIPLIRDRWLAAGLSTARADRPCAEAGVKLAYEAAGLTPPKLIIWLDSPRAGAMGAALLAGTAKAGKQVWAQVGAQVRDQVGAQVGAQVWDQVWDQVGAQVWAQVGRGVWGQHDTWLSLYAFFLEACGLACAEQLRGQFEVAQSAGWWWPFEGAVILTERPTHLHRDAELRLHCETGPALLYPDGWGIHAWHGTRVPARWIEQRDTLDPNEVIRHKNVELRAAGAAIIGWPKMLSVLDAKVINDSGSNDVGQLIELTLPGLQEPGRFLKAVCPRNGIICEGVPRVSDIDGLPIETAIAAQAWRIGDPQSDYTHPPART